MKLKLKLDLAGIKGWLLAHGEKAALGLVAVVFLLFAYYALRRETLPTANEPTKLRELATSVSQHVTSSVWDEKRENVAVVDYAERAKSKMIKAADFAMVRPFEVPVVDQKPKRGVPAVLNVEELRVDSGFDVFMIKDDQQPGAGNQAAADKTHAQPWAVVTGLVPWMRQQEEFDKNFAGAVAADAKRDTPQYAIPELQRAEVNDSQPDKLDWQALDADVRKIEGRWAGTGEEIVSAKYVDPALTGRLGKLVNEGTWGESVGHPKIPLAADEGEQRGAAAPIEPPPAEPAKDAAPGGDPRFRVVSPAKEAPAAAARASANDTEKPVEYRLLRVFDYSVEPGKKYRYRVTIALPNPNFGLPPQYLKNPENARVEFLIGEPSPPTAAVTIPDGHSVLAGVVDPGSRFTEPSAKLVVRAIDREQGLPAATEMEKVQRGSVANTPERVVKVRDPLDNQVKELKRGFQSNILILDMYGGKDLPGRRRIPPLTAPGELLLLDQNGNMTVRNELDDAAQYESSLVREPSEAEKKKNALNEKNDKDKADRDKKEREERKRNTKSR